VAEQQAFDKYGGKQGEGECHVSHHPCFLARRSETEDGLQHQGIYPYVFRGLAGKDLIGDIPCRMWVSMSRMPQLQARY